MQESHLRFSGAPIQFKQPIRPLHWVIKISDLKKSMELLELLGCRTLRHEEFDKGCEAKCNGPYAGYWSKSMVGWDIEDISFVFELTFNYGLDHYQRGNDLNAILLHRWNSSGQDVEQKVRSSSFAKEGTYDEKTRTWRLINDDFVLRFEDTRATGPQLAKGVVFNTTDKDEATRFFKKVGFT